MAVIILFELLVAYIVIRTTAYAIYCVKKTGWAGGLSVFALAAGTIFAGYITVFGNKGIG